MISYRSSSVLARARTVTTVAWDLAGFDDHGGDPAEHVSGEGTESLHEVGVLSTRAEDESFFEQRKKKSRRENNLGVMVPSSAYAKCKCAKHGKK